MFISVLEGFAEISFANKLQRFIDELPPDERRTSPLTGEIYGLCEGGFVLFDEFCEDPAQHGSFYDHLLGGEGDDGCSQCKTAFVEHVSLVVPD